ncbi:MAG: transport system permease protein [Tardiphaga sp.]|nr:transport system permease protein [Tardiphaga sp.]MDB5627362.1 transport system permease protein [Tardiphaga sp.]
MVATPAPAAHATDDLPRRPVDWLPMALVPAVALIAIPFIGSPSTWLTLTIAGLAMGVIIFMISSGLMLVFGLMDVMNFGHGAFITLGAYVGLTIFAPLSVWIDSSNLALNLLVLTLGLLAAVVVAGAVGLVFDRVLIRPVYGNHLKQILITMGGFIVVEQLIRAIWGAEMVTLNIPAALRGSLFIGDAAIERYRILALVVGAGVFAAMLLILTKTRIGLQIRAGVEDRDMLEAMGYRTRHLFVAVFVAGAMLAGMGGLMWGLYQQNFTPAIGSQANVLIFIVIIIGGLGSTTGCMIAALLVGLTTNYTGFAEPKIALFSNILLMLLVLLWRPQGLYAVVNR